MQQAGRRVQGPCVWEELYERKMIFPPVALCVMDEV